MLKKFTLEIFIFILINIINFYYYNFNCAYKNEKIFKNNVYNIIYNKNPCYEKKFINLKTKNEIKNVTKNSKFFLLENYYNAFYNSLDSLHTKQYIFKKTQNIKLTKCI